MPATSKIMFFIKNSMKIYFTGAYQQNEAIRGQPWCDGQVILTSNWLIFGILTSGWLTVSFEHSLVSGHHYIGYTAWESLNRQYSVNNVTIIVRLEFDRFSYKHKRLKKTYNRYLVSIQYIYNRYQLSTTFFQFQSQH